MNALEFKKTVQVEKFKKLPSNHFGDYTVNIDGETYTIDQLKNGTWAAWDNDNNEYYAINKTRKDVVSDIVSGLYHQYKHSIK